jgi:hypothetical protein
MSFILVLTLTGQALTYEGKPITYTGPTALHECLEAAEAIELMTGAEMECGMETEQ